ncbi:MAG: tetratricopeptide repeat protein [Rhizomicrobium sp.]|jgi:tetratricopeptide (TPR) repeat protein
MSKLQITGTVRLFVSAAFVIFLIAVSNPAHAFSHCPVVLPSPAWPLRIQILRVEAELHSYPMPSERRACSYYRRGLLQHFAHFYEKAIESYTHAVALKNDFADAYAARGDTYADLGQHEKASEDYTKVALLSSVQRARDLGLRCWVRAVRGRPLDLALADCQEALRNEPNDADALAARGLVYLRMGEYDAAIDDFNAALKLNASVSDSVYLRGLAKLRLGDTAGGNADITHVAKMIPNIADRYATWGVTP